MLFSQTLPSLARRRFINTIFARPIDVAALTTLRPGAATTRWLSLVVSAIVTAVVIYALGDTDWVSVSNTLTLSGSFWIAFTLYCLHAPLADTAIFARLWGHQPGLVTVLVKKQVLNALILPYAGDALVVDWARRHGIQAFSTVKDAAIISALAGGVATCVLVLPVWAALSTALDLPPTSLLFSVILLSAVPFLALVNRRAIFALPGSELVRIGAIHAMRIIVSIVLLAGCWHLLLPSASLNTWLMLAAARMVVSRLPLIPNKDIALAAVALAMFPHDHGVTGVIAATGVMLTLANAAVWVVLGLRDLNRSAGTTA